MNPLWLQTGCGDAYCGMIDDHLPRHRAYCERWSIDYEGVKLDTLPDYQHYWFRVDMILDRMRQGKWSHLFVSDADVLVVDHRYDMRETLPEWAFLAMVAYPWPASHCASWHLNAGFMYIRCCPEALDFFEHVWARRNQRPGAKGWCEQSVINDLFMTTDWQRGIRILSHRWNNNLHDIDSFAYPIVAAFHGHGTPEQRREIMAAYAADNPWER